MIISPPLYPQSAAANSPYSHYGNTASCCLASQSFPTGLDTSSSSVIEQLGVSLSGIAQSIYSSVMEYLAPALGIGGTQSASGTSSSSLLDNLIPYATSTKKPKTFLDKLIAWFKSIGDFGNNVSKGMKSGREILEGVRSAFTWLQENSLGDTVAGLGNDIVDSLGKIGESITGAAKALWNWLF